MSEAPWFRPGAAVVIGGSGGLGRAIVEKLAGRGSDVVFTYRSQVTAATDLELFARRHGRTVNGCKLELGDDAALRAFLEAAIESHSGIHSVVYAAGPDIGTEALDEVDPRKWRAVIEADVHGFFGLVQAVVPVLRKQGFGSVVVVTTAAVGRVPPRDVLSAAPKAAVEAIVKTIAREEGRYGIRANCVAPGWIGAGLGERMMQRGHAGDAERVLKAIPLGRIGTPEDVAEAVVFLASDRAAFITGQSLAVDGGWQI